MKLLVIVLCLLSERFLLHTLSQKRFTWFPAYVQNLKQRLSGVKNLGQGWLFLIILLLPILLLAGVILYLFGEWFFGFIGLFLNLLIFHYCLGPQNPFYPVNTESANSKQSVGEYLAEVNGQLFAVIFWYIVLGPLAILAYRIISLSRKEEVIGKEATYLTTYLDWAPAKLTSFLYLLVGNFQAGFQHFARLFFTAPAQNDAMLSLCGLSAVDSQAEESFLMPQAETLVEHSVIVLLVLLAILTIAAWL